MDCLKKFTQATTYFFYFISFSFFGYGYFAFPKNTFCGPVLTKV